jgi:Transposase IS4
MSTNDPRYVVGARVHAKALHVTAAAECHRRYGSNAKTKFLNGVVVAVDMVPSSTKKRAVTLITADYDLGGGTFKRHQLNSRSVKAGIAPLSIVVVPEPVTETVTENSNPIDNTIVAPTGADSIPIIPFLGESRIDDETVTLDTSVGSPDPPVIRMALPTAPVAAIETTDAILVDVVATANGLNWVRASRGDPPLNGNVPFRQWSVRSVVGDILYPGGPTNGQQERMSPLDYFLLMFPPKQLTAMVQLTNVQLHLKDLQPTTTGELLKWFGLIILTTKFEFASRASLWSTIATSKYRPAPQFGLTGMSRNRFDDLFSAIRWSYQPIVRLGDLSSEQYRWMLIDDFVTNFNDHRANYFNPSDTICVDESMSRWYGQGGHWINHGLPQYIAIDRKPENGCEIQNAACGKSGVMLRLKLVKGADLVGDDNENNDGDENNLLHGTLVLKYLVSPWCGSHRIVCADSYFASVGAAKELYANGLRFIGVVKTATRGFPKQFLSAVELANRGDFLALKSVLAPCNDAPEAVLAAFVWMDRERRYFISTAGSLEAGTPYTRCRWRQVDPTPNAPPERVQLTIEQPKIAEIYYSTCASIDRHNRCRQDNLGIEKKIETKDWSMRVNLSIFSMIVVDSWQVYSSIKNHGNPHAAGNQKDFYSMLSEELIDNTYDVKGGRSMGLKRSPTSNYHDACLRTINGQPRSGVLTHLTPSKRRKNSKGEQTTFRYQGRCKECQKKTTWQCSDCGDNEKMVYLCSTKNGQRCFLDHLNRNHAYLDEFSF